MLNECLAPDQKVVRPKKVTNDQKINLALFNFLVFFVEKLHNLSFNDITHDIITKVDIASSFGGQIAGIGARGRSQTTWTKF